MSAFLKVSSLLLLCITSSNAAFYGGFQYEKPDGWLPYRGYDVANDGVTKLYHPTELKLILERREDGTWMTTDDHWNHGFKDGLIEGSPIFELPLTHLDGAFFATIVKGKTYFIQFIFTETDSDWEVSIRIKGGSKALKMGKGRQNAMKYGDVDSWYQYFHPSDEKNSYPYYQIQGLTAKCPLFSLNVLLQGSEITVTEMNAITATKYSDKKLTGNDALEGDTTTKLQYAADKIIGGVWPVESYADAEQKRHVKPVYHFELGQHIKVLRPMDGYNGLDDPNAGSLVMNMEYDADGLIIGQLYIYIIKSDLHGWIWPLDATQESEAVDLGAVHQPDRMDDRNKFRYVTVAEVWGFETKELITRVGDKFVAKYKKRVDQLKWKSATSKTPKLINCAFPMEGYDRIKTALKMPDGGLYQTDEDLPYNLLGIRFNPPGHFYAYRKVYGKWWNLDSGFAGKMLGRDLSIFGSTYRTRNKGFSRVLVKVRELLKKPKGGIDLILRYPEFKFADIPGDAGLPAEADGAVGGEDNAWSEYYNEYDDDEYYDYADYDDDDVDDGMGYFESLSELEMWINEKEKEQLYDW